MTTVITKRGIQAIAERLGATHYAPYNAIFGLRFYVPTPDGWSERIFRQHGDSFEEYAGYPTTFKDVPPWAIPLSEKENDADI